MASLNNPQMIASDGTNLYVTDTNSLGYVSFILKVAAGGSISTFAGSSTTGYDDTIHYPQDPETGETPPDQVGTFTNITGIVYNASDSKLYIMDNGLLRSVALNGDVSTISFPTVIVDDLPVTFAFDGGEFGLASNGNGTLYTANGSGKVYRMTVGETPTGQELTTIEGNLLTMCWGDGSLYITDNTDFTKIYRVNAVTGQLVYTYTTGGTTIGYVWYYDSKLYYAENQTIHYLSGNTFVLLAGGESLYVNGNGASAGFGVLLGITNMGSNLYVVDNVNFAIRQVGTSSPYPVTTYAGIPPAVGAPTLTITPGDGQLTLTWTDGALNGNASQTFIIINYVSGEPNPLNIPFLASPHTITGLTNGTEYTYVVAAAGNLNTTEVQSEATYGIPAASTGPVGVPTVTITPGDTQVTLSWTDGELNGNESQSFYINQYDGEEVTVLAGNVTSPYTITGLTNGTQYTYTVVATGNVDQTEAESTQMSATAGAVGDPYVTTFSNKTYKLPVINAPIRYFQTMEAGKLLTINAQLKTVDSADLGVNTIQSLIKLKGKMTAKQYDIVAKKALTSETLSFFERISIQHGEERLVVNLWNSAFEIVENKSSFLPKIVERQDLLAKVGGIYNQGYKAKTVKFQFGSTSLFLSVYNSPMVRNGISVMSGATRAANGVIVNTLSEASMRLRSLEDTAPVSTVDSKKARTIVETFVDSEGLRTKNITTYH